jgi:undecaprenyl-diphosphatase
VTEIFQALVLGVIQGLTEFLPISSSAHLIIVPWLFGWEPFGLSFDVAVHLGTLAAVITFFRKDLLLLATATARSLPVLARGKMPGDPMARLGVFIGLGSIPAVVAGLLAEEWIDGFYHDGEIEPEAIALIAAALIVLGLLLWIADRWSARRANDTELSEIRLWQALAVGFAQSLALIPGVSRSGGTITAGLFSGLSRPLAARFSFLLGVPIVLGAGLKEMIDLARTGLARDEYAVFATGVLSAAVVGYLAIAGLLRFVQRRSMVVFVIYRVLLGGLLLILVAAGFRG